LTDLSKVTAYEREVMALVHVSYRAYPFHRSLVADATTERVAGISGIDHDSALPHDLGGLTDQSRLRVFGMDGEKLRQLL
jgi:hypothetical protein